MPTLIQKRMLSMLKDTVKFYSADPSRRGVVICEERTLCKYETQDGRRCAIGRYLSDKDIGKLKSLNMLMSSPGNIKEHITTKKILQLPLQFLYDLQELHDWNEHWDEHGITDEGEVYAKQIEDKILSDYYNYNG